MTDFIVLLIAAHFGITQEQAQQIMAKVPTVQKLLALYDQAKPLIADLEPEVQIILAAAKANA